VKINISLADTTTVLGN